LIRAGAFSRHGIGKETPINGARKSGVKVQKPTHEIFQALMLKSPLNLAL